MERKDLQLLADAYLDGEVTPATRVEIEANLADCTDHPIELARRRDLSRRLKAGTSYFKAPEGLTCALAHRLPDTGNIVTPPRPATPRSREAFWRPAALAA